MKKVYSRPSLKAYPMKHQDIICGSGYQTESLRRGSSPDTPESGIGGYIWGE